MPLSGIVCCRVHRPSRVPGRVALTSRVADHLQLMKDSFF
jgi:hypothetical protein